MKKMMLVLAVLLAVTATFGGAVQSAHAQAIGTIVYVAPGTRQCLAPALTANLKIYAQGQVLSGPNVKFVVARNNVHIYESVSTEPAFIYPTNRTIRPDLFPGTFQVCARNFGTTTSQVFLGLSTDNDAP